MKIALLGDIAFLGEFSIKKNPDIIKNLKPISDYLSGFDFVIGNLETPFSHKKKTNGAKSAYLGTDVKNVELLRALHVSAVSIANNHIFDYGEEGFNTTIKTLEENGIGWFGADGKDFSIEKENNKIVFNGFCCYSTNPLKIARAYGDKGLNPFGYHGVNKILKENHQKGVLNILAVHSGEEHVNTPSLPQIEISRRFAESAPYIFYGHHPHVIQGIEVYKNSLIAHSLGNFCFSGCIDEEKKIFYPLSDNNLLGMILEVEIVDNKIMSYKPTLIKIDERGSINIEDNEDLVKSYSNQLKEAIENPGFYKERRRKQREEYMIQRRDLRNLKWYLKRLRPRYIKLFLTNRNNAKKFKEFVVDPINKAL